MTHQSIPFHATDIGPEEIAAVVQALKFGDIVGAGPISQSVQKQLQEVTGAGHVLLTTSCTHAMEMALLASEIRSGDEVILPSFTFTSTANAIVLRGARPVFAEITPDTLTLDPANVARKITKRTRAIMAVHYAGVACAMDDLTALAKEHGLLVIEDAAQGIGARYKGRMLGTIGDIGCYSFHATKHVTCGEGGAFLTNDDELFQRAEIIREKGTNRSAFLRGQVDKYTWVDYGSSYVLSDVLAAILGVQIKRMQDFIAARKQIHERYMTAFRPLAEAGFITLPVLPDSYDSNYHIFFLRTRTEGDRNRLLAELHAHGIGAAFHYIPLHSSPFGRGTLGCEDELPVTDNVSATLLRLPIYPELREDQQLEIIATVTDLFNHNVL